MRPISIAFASALMLGGMSTAYAQDGPEKDRERPAQAQEQQGQSGGADRGKAETKANRGTGDTTSESRGDRNNGADRSGQKGGGNEAQGERRNRDGEGQGKPRHAQDEKSSQPQKDNERASKGDDANRASKKGEAESGKAQRETKRESSRDEDSKAADRSDRSADQDTEKRATQKDESDKRDRAQTKDDADKRAATEKDKDAKRAGSEDRQDRDDSANRADRKDGERDGKSARVELQGEKRNKVQSAFRERSGDVRERTNVDIDISVGRALPRDWDYYPLPAAIIEVVPEYRGYRYVYVDDRYVIIEPDTYEVVTVIEAGGSGRASTASRGGCSSDLALSSEDREYLLKSVQMRNEVDVSGVSIGWRVPDSVELEVFPGPVTQRISGLGSCRYFVVDDRIAIVDPDAHNVVILVQD